MDRREFLRIASLRAVGAGVALSGFPTIIRASALGLNGSVAPSNRIVMGAVGLGWMGAANVNSFLNKPEVQIVALCDVDPAVLKERTEAVNKHYENQDCATYVDYREMLARDDLDAAMLALPDHWHGVAAVDALSAGCDVYAEKPLARSLLEGRAIVEATRRYGRIWQTGSWQRSTENFRRACEMVRSGRIGKVTRVDVGLGDGHADWNGTKDRVKPEPPPAGFDYDRWLGPAQWTPYCPAKLHKTWRWNLDYGGGMLLDWVGHHVDIAHWGLDLDHTGPVEVECTGTFGTGFWNAPLSYHGVCKYANGLEMTVSSANPMGTKWIGDRGSIWVTRGDFSTDPKSIGREPIKPEERLYTSTDHWQNFVDGVKSRAETITPAESSHRSASVAQLCLISMQVGRKLRWDPVKERFLNDPEADRLLMSPMRSPYHL
jgi:predicted dehydrogenase